MSFASYRAELAAWALLQQLAPAAISAATRSTAQTNQIDPDAPAPEPESRQVRRARLRREMKLRHRRGY